jgi:Ca2+-transporting ATPase
MKKYLTYLLQCNICEMIVLGSLVLAGFPLPLLPAAILYVNLATDGLPAIALGVSPPDPDIMQRPPRDSKETIFGKEVRVLLTLIPLIASPLLIGLFVYSLQSSSLETARTRLFLTFVLLELAIALNCRSLKYPITKVKPHKLLSAAIFWEVLLITALLAFVPAVLDAFEIVFPTLLDIGIAVGLCLVVFTCIEFTKRYIISKAGQQSK